MSRSAGAAPRAPTWAWLGAIALLAALSGQRVAATLAMARPAFGGVAPPEPTDAPVTRWLVDASCTQEPGTGRVEAQLHALRRQNPARDLVEVAPGLWRLGEDRGRIWLYAACRGTYRVLPSAYGRVRRDGIQALP